MTKDIENQEDEVVLENDEIVEDIKEFDPSDIVVYSRDWTIETIISQINITTLNLTYNRLNSPVP